MNEESREAWEAEVVIDPNTKQAAGYKIKGITYVLANHMDNIHLETYHKLENLNGFITTINLMYISDAETQKKLLVGFFIINVIYLNEIYRPLVIDNTQIYTMKKQLAIKGFSCVKPDDEIALNFNKATKDVKLSFVREKEQKPLLYSEQKIYKLHLVFNKIATGAIKCIIDGKTFLFTTNVGGKGKKNILDLHVGSSVKMRAVVREKNIVALVLCGVMFIKSSYYTESKYNELISQESDCNIDAHVEVIENNTKPIVLVSSEEQAAATFLTINLAHASNAEAKSLVDGCGTDSEINLSAATSLKYDFYTKIKRSMYNCVAIPTVKTKRYICRYTKNHEDIETTRLTDSSAENLQESNSRHCNIL